MRLVGAPLHPAVIAAIAPAIPALKARLWQHPSEIEDGLLSISVEFDGGEGFARVYVSSDIVADVPPPHRAHHLRRAEAALHGAARRLEDRRVEWVARSHTTEDWLIRGVDAKVRSPVGGQSTVYAYFSGPGPVPVWYMGLRRLAIASALRRIDLRNAEIEDR